MRSKNFRNRDAERHWLLHREKRVSRRSLNDFPASSSSIDPSLCFLEKRNGRLTRRDLSSRQKIRCAATRDRQIESGPGQTEREEEPRRIKKYPVLLDTLTHRPFALRYRVNKVPKGRGIRVSLLERARDRTRATDETG